MKTVYAFLSYLVLVAGLFLSPAHALAISISGILHNPAPNQPLKLELKDSGLVPLQIKADLSTLQLLRGLRHGDLVFAQGDVSPDGKSVTILTIDRLGLQELIGAWRTDRWEIFEFKNYFHLELFIPFESAGETNFPSRTRKLTYVVSPASNDRFSIFLSGENDVRLGFMKMSARRLVIDITNPHTGQVSESISLVPVENR